VTGVLMCKVNFSTQARVGDRFKLMLEETWFQDSVWIGGKVLFASYEGKLAGKNEAFRYEDPDPKSTFNAHYTESGEALIFSGMRYPLDRLHITSPFGWRIHPLKGVRDFHAGVDYGSPFGAAVYAVADGKVVVSGYDPYSGNKIAVQHADRSSSWYLHLSARGVRAGQMVNARQVIGRVGSTGRSTGPHLHFGFKQPNGAWTNPLIQRMIATPKLEGERLKRLRMQIAKIRQEMAATESSAAKSVNDTTNATVKSRKVS
jgi:murein DD-endopeptidase MepM/ murein hydrolase activator NlpD